MSRIRSWAKVLRTSCVYRRADHISRSSGGASGRSLSQPARGRFPSPILFDKRGAGMSDRIEGVPTVEERMDDVRAVMDAVESPRAALVGMSEGGAIGARVRGDLPRAGQLPGPAGSRHPVLDVPRHRP